MKPYGHSRSDKLECKYGCCTSKSGVLKACRALVDRANRKSARQAAKKELAAMDKQVDHNPSIMVGE